MSTVPPSPPTAAPPVDPHLAPKDAHPSVAAAHARVQAELPFHDRQDYEDAARGFIDTIPDAIAGRWGDPPAGNFASVRAGD